MELLNALLPWLTQEDRQQGQTDHFGQTDPLREWGAG